MKNSKRETDNKLEKTRNTQQSKKEQGQNHHGRQFRENKKRERESEADREDEREKT